MTTPPKPTLRNIANLATKPRWCAGMLGTRSGAQFGNIVGHATGIGDMSSLSAWTARSSTRTLNWDDVRGSKSGGAASSC